MSKPSAGRIRMSQSYWASGEKCSAAPPEGSLTETAGARPDAPPAISRIVLAKQLHRHLGNPMRLMQRSLIALGLSILSGSGLAASGDVSGIIEKLGSVH